MKRLLLLAVAGGIGTLARYALDGYLSTHSGRHSALPLGTIAVNVSGCFLIGFLAAGTWISPEWRDLSMIGFCGGFTTFSTYGLQTLDLASDARWVACGLNVVGSNALGFLAVWLGRTCGLLLRLPAG